MRAVKIIVACWLLLMLALWVRSGSGGGFPLIDALPFMGRRHHLGPEYEYAAIAMVALGVWGYMRLMRRG